MNDIADDITKIIGARADHVRNLLGALDNGDQEASRIARETLNDIPGITNELLASLKISMAVDTLNHTIAPIKKYFDAIQDGTMSCRPIERLQNKVLLCVVLAILSPIVVGLVMFMLTHK